MHWMMVETTGSRQGGRHAPGIIAETWRDIGVGCCVRAADRDVLRNRVYAGQVMMACATGWDNGQNRTATRRSWRR